MDLERLKKKVAEIEKQSNIMFSEMKKVIVPGVPNIVRIVGEWASVRRAWLECDDGKVRPFNVKNEREGSVLWDTLTLLFQKDKVFDHRTGRVFTKYIHASKLGDLMYKIYPSRENRGWSSGEIFVMNCIDRMDSWCKENKHTKLLTKTESEIGIGWKAFQSFCKEVENWGDPEGYDLNFTKTGSDLKTEYAVSRANPQKYPQVVEGPLTSEEKSYELYDVFQLTEITKSEIVLQYLENILSSIDRALGTTFVRDLTQSRTKTTVAVESVPRTENVLKTESQSTFSFKKYEPQVQPESVQTERQKPNKPSTFTTMCPVCGKPVQGDRCEECGIRFV